MDIKRQTAACVLFTVVQSHTTATEREQIILFAIPAQQLSAALLHFAETSHVKIFFKATITRNLSSQALIGHYTLPAALEKLLENTNIKYRFTQTKSINLYISNQSLPAKPPLAHTSLPKALSQPIYDNNTIENLTPVILEDFTINSLPTGRYSSENSYSATKTDSPILELPHSIQIIPLALLNDQQVVTVTESLLNVSGVFPRNPSISPNFEPTLIRGFAGMQMIDGFYQNLNTGDQESLINIQQIEVLKGANATLYSGGSGSPAGGVINMVSKLPDTQASYEMGVKAGNYQFTQPFIDINHPVNDQLLLRFTGEYTHSASHIDVLQTERYNLNPSISYHYNDKTTLTLQGKYSTWQRQDYQGLPATGSVTGDFRIAPELYIGPSNIKKSHSEFAGVWGTFKHKLNNTWSITAKARYAHSEHDTFSQGILGEGFDFSADQPLSAADFSTIGLPPTPHTWALSNNELYQLSNAMSLQVYASAKFAFGVSRNTLLIAGDYSQMDEKSFMNFDLLPIGLVDLTIPNFPPYQYPGARKNNQFTKNTTFGSTLQLQSTLYKHLHLLLGLRVGNVTTDYQNTTPGFEFNSYANTTRALPNIGAVIDLSNEFAFFVNYTEGMRGQSGVNFVTPPKPELSKQVELGLKFALAAPLSGQLSLYQITRENIVVTDFNDPLLRATSKGQQRSRGFETNMRWQVTTGLNMLATYAFTDAKFTDSLSVPTGTHLPGVPKHSGRFWLNYAFQPTFIPGLSIGTGVYAQSGSYLSNANLFRSDAYYTVDTNLAYSRGIYKLGIAIKNLTNNHYYQRLNYFGTRATPARGTEVIFTGSITL